MYRHNVLNMCIYVYKTIGVYWFWYSNTYRKYKVTDRPCAVCHMWLHRLVIHISI